MSLIETRAAELSDELAFLDREEKFEWIIDRGKSLPEGGDFSDDEIVKGCQSKVWLRVHAQNGNLAISGTSDALLVKGIVSLLIELFNEAPIQDARGFDFIGWMNRNEISLSMQRMQGLEGMLRRIKSVG